MIYQGEQVNFSQVSNAQFTGALNMIGGINTALYTYPQKEGLASEKSDSDIWKNLGMYVYGTSGKNSRGVWGANQNAIMPKLDRAVNKNTNQDESIMNNKMQIENMNTRLSGQVTDLGNSINQINKDHKNMGKGNGGNPFDFLTSFTGGLGISTAVLAAGGLGAYLLLRKK